MDWYNDQVEECTVYVSLSEVSTYSPPSEGFGSRFVSALSAGWQNFVGGLQQVIVALAGAWPVVVIAAAACEMCIRDRSKPGIRHSPSTKQKAPGIRSTGGFLLYWVEKYVILKIRR